MTGPTLPADLCLIGGMLMDCAADGSFAEVEWRFIAERDIAARDSVRRAYHLTFILSSRTFRGMIMRGGAYVDELAKAEVQTLRALLPDRELAKALALSITRPAP